MSSSSGLPSSLSARGRMPLRPRQDNALDAAFQYCKLSLPPASAAMLNQVCYSISAPVPESVRFEAVLEECDVHSDIPAMAASTMVEDHILLDRRMDEVLELALKGGYTSVCSVLSTYHPLINFDSAWKIAVTAASEPSVDWLMDCDIDFDPLDASFWCAASGNVLYLDRLRARPFQGWRADDAFRGALRCDNPDAVFDWMLGEGYSPSSGAVMEEAAMHGNVNAMQRMLDTGLPLTPACMLSAVGGRSLAAVKYLCDMGCPRGEGSDACDQAVCVAAPDILACLADSGYTVSASTMTLAVMAGNMDTVKWLHERGCPWGADTYSQAVYFTPEPEFLAWMLDAGCPMSEAAVDDDEEEEEDGEWM